MPFRRRSKKLSPTNQAARAACEQLENRTLLTALIGGVFSNTNTIFDGTNTFIYRQANGNANIKISVSGNVTAEFIGARAPMSAQEALFNPSNVILTDLLPSTAPAFVAPTATTPAFNVPTHLFGIYIVSADINSVISISQIGADGTMTPFGGGLPMNVFDASTGLNVNITPTDGAVYIGSQIQAIAVPAPAADIVNRPLIFANQIAFGMRPASAGEMFAGIETAPGVSIGKILIGGTITGIVDIKGNVDTFYAGNILTGDAAGILVDSAETQFTNIGHFPRNNFHIEGDIYNLLSANSFGTLSATTLTANATAGQFLAQQYKTGFQLDVYGGVGYMFGDDSFSGRAIIRNLPDMAGSGAAQREIEYVTPGIPVTGTLFDADFTGINATIGAATMDVRFLNDTYDSAQYLGSFRSTDLRQDNVIQLRGSLRNQFFGTALATTPDPRDFYAVSLLAGQVIDVKLDDGLGDLETAFHPRLGIMDPRGRLIATDYSNLGQYSRVNKTIRIKADIPGTYRIVIAHDGDYNFSGTVDAATEFNQLFRDPIPYELRITNVGNIALGGLVVNQHIATLDAEEIGIQVLTGDIGEIRAGQGATVDGRAVAPAQGQGQIFSLSDPWYVPAGHLRSMMAFSMGISGALISLGTGPDLQIRKGSIGLLRTLGATLTNTMAVNDTHFTYLTAQKLYPLATDDLSQTPSWLAVGQDIQVIDCAGVLEGTFLANRAIGTIRTQQLGGITLSGTASPQQNIDVFSDPIIQTNVDTIGSDGVIDLIDVTLNTAGTTSVYNPAIATGPNGNLRYFHIAPNATVRADRFFGGGIIVTPTNYAPGAQATITDDSGARIVLTPIPRVKNTLFPVPINALSEFLDPPELAVMTYPIRDKSGVAIMRVIVEQNNDPFSDGVTDINRPGGGGMHVQVNSTNPRAAAEIAEINLSTTPGTATSNPFTFNPFTETDAGIPARSYQEDPPPDDPTLVIRPLDLIFEGGVPVDVYEIVATAAQIIHSIDNQTRGEILNIGGGLAAAGPDILAMSAQSIGIGKRSTGALVEGALQRVVNTAPFTDQRVLINIGDVALIRARGAIGNVQAVNIGTIQANYDGKNTSGTFEGIAAPIYSIGPANQLIGNIVRVDIGEGVAPSGSGGVATAAAGGGAAAAVGLIRGGIFADGLVDLITGKGDIRGDIVVTGNTAFVQQQSTDAEGNALINPDGTPLLVNTPRSVIGAIRLTGGSIVDADIITATFDQSLEPFIASSTLYTATELALTPTEVANDPDFDIGVIRLEGTGGILGAFIFAPDVGAINVAGGFGVMNSFIANTGDGVIHGITTDGLGIRGVELNASAGSVRTLAATGSGGRVATTAYSASVRQSETGLFDAQSGQALDTFNDLHQFLGTSTRRPVRVGISETGLIVDTIATGSGNLNNVEAFRILGRDVIDVDANGRRFRIPFGNAAYPMRFNFGNSINNVMVRDVVDGLSLSTGRLKNFSAGNDVSYTALNVGTSLDNFYAGAFRGTSSLKMTTVAGTLQNFRTKRSLYGVVVVSQDIVNMTVGTDIGSPLIRASRDIGTLKVTGSTLTGASITAGRTLKSLNIGQDVQQGSTIRAKAILRQRIGGQILGDIIIG